MAVLERVLRVLWAEEEEGKVPKQQYVIASYCWGAKLAITVAQSPSAGLAAITPVHQPDVRTA